MEKNRRDQGTKQTAEEVRVSMLDKLHEERKYWTERLEKEQKRNEEKLAEVKQASNNLLSTIVRTCGKQSIDDNSFYLSIPIPQNGYITAGARQGNRYILKCIKEP